VFAVVSLEMRGGGRYGYAPAVLLLVALINAVYSSKHGMAVASTVMLVFILSANAVNYFNTKLVYDNNWVSYSAALQEAERNGGTIRVFPQWVGWSYVIRLPQANPL
jgi:hypothetical protein